MAGQDANHPEPCPLCSRATPAAAMAEAGWMDAATEQRLRRHHPDWHKPDGACPACVQQALLELLFEQGEAALHDGVQKSWPLDAEAAFGALPTPLRLHADPRNSGQGVTLAIVDAGFHPHPDIVAPRNRVRAFVDASRDPIRVQRYTADELPRWPGWDTASAGQWHGTMTSVVAAGNGQLSHGLYRGLAPNADLVLLKVAGDDGRIGNAAIVRALDWLRWHGAALGLRVVSLSLGGDSTPLAHNAVDRAVASLVAAGICVVVAAGNDGRRMLTPPATAPEALTVGGLDDSGTFEHADRELWHSNYGADRDGCPKPELVAPSLWVVAPLLPGTQAAQEAADLFARRAAGDATVEGRLAELKLVTPHYKHVEGTSFAAPVVAAIAACMIEAHPGIAPRAVRDGLIATAEPIPGADEERQGAGAVNAGRAVAHARQAAAG